MDTVPTFNHGDGGSKHDYQQVITQNPPKKGTDTEHEDLNDLLDLGLDLDFETAYQIFTDPNDLSAGIQSTFSVHMDGGNSFGVSLKRDVQNIWDVEDHEGCHAQTSLIMPGALDHNYHIPSLTPPESQSNQPHRPPELHQMQHAGAFHGIQLPQPGGSTVSGTLAPILHNIQTYSHNGPMTTAYSFTPTGVQNTMLPHSETSKSLLRPQIPKYQNMNYVPGGELLSTVESTAIEHFLDALVTNEPIDDVNIKETTKDMEGQQPRESPRRQTVPEEIASPSGASALTPELEKKDTNVKGGIGEVVEEDSSDTHTKNVPDDDLSLVDDEYIPPKFNIPDIKINISDVPPEVSKCPTLLKKWKHVQVEKIRRDQTKALFNELIELLRDGVDGHGKRVPKYLLLGSIVKDIKGLVSANRELEQIFQKMGG